MHFKTNLKISDLVSFLEAVKQEIGDVYVIGADDCHITDIDVLPESFDPETDETVKMVQIK